MILTPVAACRGPHSTQLHDLWIRSEHRVALSGQCYYGASHGPHQRRRRQYAIGCAPRCYFGAGGCVALKHSSWYCSPPCFVQRFFCHAHRSNVSASQMVLVDALRPRIDPPRAWQQHRMKDDTKKLFQNVPETLRNFLLNDGFSRQHCTAFWRHPESLHKQAIEHLLAPCLLLSFAAMQMSTIHTDTIGGIGFNLRGDVAYAVVLNELSRYRDPPVNSVALGVSKKRNRSGSASSASTWRGLTEVRWHDVLLQSIIQCYTSCSFGDGRRTWNAYSMEISKTPLYSSKL